MSNICTTPFGTFSPVYREKGLRPLPLKYPGVDKQGRPVGKACFETGWQLPDDQADQSLFDRWEQDFPQYNIGLRMGSLLPSGLRLGALDVDDDRYVCLLNGLIGDVRCGRIGKKGLVAFVQYDPRLKSEKIRVKGANAEETALVLELLFHGSLCVIPPSIHPITQSPYRWIGEPLHEIDFNTLPIIGA